MNQAPKEAAIELDHFHHQPYQLLTGRVRLTSALKDRKLELRVFWFTRGRADEEAGIRYRIPLTPQEELTEFSWKLPATPYSFAGQLITLAWAVEVVDEKERSLDLVPFLLSPTGEEIQLDYIPDDSRVGKFKKRFKQKATSHTKR